jgi:O-acetyl-ADP-ribose deacetylase (regulator of RNase III)
VKIEYKTADILAAPERIVVQGCNAKGVMGKGLAKQIRDRHPVVFETYRREYETRGLPLGSIVWVADGPHRVFANAITQDDYRRDPREPAIHADYVAIAQVVDYLDAIAMLSLKETFHADIFETTGVRFDEPVERIALPLIGAGLAGGSWKMISSIIETRSKNFTPVVYLLDGQIPTT